MNRRRLRLKLIPATLLAILAMQDPAWAQDNESWDFIFAPQVWVSHIAKNGFVAPSGLGNRDIFGHRDLAGHRFFNEFRSEDARPVDSVNPQWGFQIGARRGRWNLAASFQYVGFETRSDIVWRPQTNVDPQLPNPGGTVDPHSRVAQEFTNTTRIDMDFAASHYFPEAIAPWLDLTVGGGLKVIYATASRQYANLSPWAAYVSHLRPTSGTGTGLFATCTQDDCSDFHFRERVKTTSWLYGATMPVSAILHLTSDANWLLGLSSSPFIGAETRDDHNVVYRVAQDVYNEASAAEGPPPGYRVKRLDGTTFAYGVTFDATVRWLISDNLLAYAGARIQYIRGHEQYLAYGPLFGVSFRFWGR